MHRAIRKGKEERDREIEREIFLSWGPNVEGEFPTMITSI
jgi:hypothetical protein